MGQLHLPDTGKRQATRNQKTKASSLAVTGTLLKGHTLCVQTSIYDVINISRIICQTRYAKMLNVIFYILFAKVTKKHILVCLLLFTGRIHQCFHHTVSGEPGLIICTCIYTGLYTTVLLVVKHLKMSNMSKKKQKTKKQQNPQTLMVLLHHLSQFTFLSNESCRLVTDC